MRIKSQRYLPGWALIALAAVLWGFDLIFRAPLAAAGIPSATIVLGEHLILGVLFLPILVSTQRVWRAFSPGDWGTLLFLGWGGSALATWIYTQAFVYGKPLEAVLLQKTQPLFALVLAGIVLKERRSPLFWLLAAIAGVGAYLVAFGPMMPQAALQSASWKAAACAVGASALWGFGTVAGRSIAGKYPPELVAGWRFTLAIPLLLLIALLQPVLWPPHLQFTSGIATNWILVAVISGALGMYLYYQGLKTTTASVATLAELAYPLTALGLGLFTLHAHLSPYQVTGLVILISAIYLIDKNHAVAQSPANQPLASTT